MTGDVLLCELSQLHVSTAIAQAASKQVQQLSYYELKSGLLPDTLRNILETEKLEPGAIKRVVLSNALKEVVLVPAQHFTKENATQFYTNQFGNGDDMICFDEVTDYKLHVVHAVPDALLQELQRTAEPELLHFYSCVLRSNNGVDAEEVISVHFTGKEIRVVAKREGQLKLAQTYLYTTPLDVVYYLLAICQQYGFAQSVTKLILSGLVSQDSAMYKELHQYFSNLQFWKPALKTVLQSEHPPHFFSSLYNLAACAL